ncbi:MULTISPECIES: malto-oligosyltrehalose synthase [unclassified Pseudomonas]|uniref:malto-oligosyltrehalose synthase n=1 Tax=unclassified Pseudomonas TaxID=196821 RepID=UPI000837B00B|nr:MULTISPECIES: malto-oligosyltrehalose synthase [unclassified Pseudomonas]QIH07853.1 malto-oligosyltrehalose synthase [Pseudomonas sp. BIOMIG1BAC]
MTGVVRASLRLQFHRGFTLDDAVPLVPYFASLGISHIYASPLLCARAGSLHGYDVVDPTRVNPELGGEAALERLVAALRQHDMGLILDIVSNHMAVGGDDNPWWLDLLRWGRLSPYGEFFDIQWHSPDPLLEGQLLLPFLGSDYGQALQEGSLQLCLEEDCRGFHVRHHEHRFPICPSDYAPLLRPDETRHPEAGAALKPLADDFAALRFNGDAHAQALLLQEALAQALQQPLLRRAVQERLHNYDSRHAPGFERLHQLLEQQSYRLASWRTAADDINWRRFFDINELAGLRVERPRVFAATHAKIFELIERHLVDGLRIDHIDGLADPRGYCRKLRRRVDRLHPGQHLPIYVEKILGDGETLHRDWGVDGSTGYEFMNQLSLLQHASSGQAVLGELWSRHSERPAHFAEEARLARQQVLNGSLAGDFESVAQALLQVARLDLMSRDLTLGAIRRALQELIVHFPVYRTYIGACGRGPEDQRFFQQAMEGARASLGEADWPVLDYLQRWFGGQGWRQQPLGQARKLLRHAGRRFQQLTSPAAAKAVEDTAFYRSAVSLARNDVGFNSEVFSAPMAAFHQACIERLASFPDNLLASATHDHKRGEDSRARLAVLSERATWYARQVDHWRALATPLRPSALAPSAADELILYQVLLGSWPLDLHTEDRPALQAYAGRIWQWQEKALREAKLHSSWASPNRPYEEAVHAFIEHLLLSPQGSLLRQSIAAAANAIAPAGALNSLVQTMLRLTVPGVADLYQGNEFWDLSLVDPDNRRPVDYPTRQRALEHPAPLACQLAQWREGPIKQGLIARTLRLRRQHPGLFQRGSYRPLTVLGQHAGQVLAFAREYRQQRLLVVVPIQVAELLGDSTCPQVAPELWGDTRVQLPFAVSRGNLNGLFSNGPVTAHGELMLSEVLRDFTLNLLIEH